MKNIVFVISSLEVGGAQRAISLLADKLSGTDAYHVDIVVLSPQREGSFFQMPPQVRLHFVDVIGASNGLLDALLSNYKRITTLRHMIKSLKADIVITFQTETNCVVVLSTLGLGVPVIVSERSDPHVYPASKLWRLIRRLVYPLTSGAVFQTAYAAGFFKGVIKHHAVIFNPVSIEESVAADRVVAEPYILGVGRLSPEKGFDDLIRAHALTKQKMPDLKLVLVGSGPQKAALESLADSLGTKADVIFAGAQTQLAGYYKNAWAFVLPSRFEGLPNSLIEAMTYGCPVVVTPLYKAGPEIVQHGHNGLIAASGTAEGFSDQLIDLINNSDKKQRLAQAGLADSSRFASAHIVAQWQSYIDSFLK